MSAKIPEETIDQIRNASDIVEVISNYLTLTKKGKNYFGLCPFHPEKTPSFSVSPEKQIFHCFGCGKGGNVFTFLMEHEKLSFIEAVRMLAQKAGIPLSYEQKDAAQFQEREALFETARFAARFFYYNLTATKTGQVGLDYFQQRQVTKDIIKKFGLGFALNLWDGLLKSAQKRTIKAELLEKCGLIIPRKDGAGFYDRFRNRVIFPVFNATGRVVAFGGRRLADDNTPKYINSPETPIYQKREILYGLGQTRQMIQAENRVVMVEGYMDLISLFQAGIQNVVATAGTALTPEHARLIARYTRNIVLLYDGDAAGANAALRGLDVLLENDLDVNVVQLPAEHDPDSYVKTAGVAAMQELIQSAKPLVEFKLLMLAETQDLTSAAGKAEAVRSILNSVIKIKDEIKQNITIRELAERFFLDERLLLRELDQLKRRLRSTSKPSVQTAEKTPATTGSPKAAQPKMKVHPAELAITRLLVRNSALHHFIFLNLDFEKIRQPVLREIVEIIYLFYQERKKFDPAKLISYFDNPKVAAFITGALNESFEFQTEQNLAVDCIVALEKRDILETRTQLELELREREKNKADTTSIIKKIQELTQLIQMIEQKKFIKSPKKT